MTKLQGRKKDPSGLLFDAENICWVAEALPDCHQEACASGFCHLFVIFKDGFVV